MTILSSREHSCIHPVVSKGKNKNEECKKLLDGSVVCGDPFICHVRISHDTACLSPQSFVYNLCFLIYFWVLQYCYPKRKWRQCKIVPNFLGGKLGALCEMCKWQTPVLYIIASMVILSLCITVIYGTKIKQAKVSCILSYMSKEGGRHTPHNTKTISWAVTAPTWIMVAKDCFLHSQTWYTVLLLIRHPAFIWNFALCTQLLFDPASIKMSWVLMRKTARGLCIGKYNIHL